MRKIILTAAFAGFCLFGMTGCGPSMEEGGGGWTARPSVPVSSQKEEQKDGIRDYSGDFVYSGGLMQIGDDENGYIQVPDTFVPFQEEGVQGLTQYCNPSGTAIITLDFYEGVNYEAAANNMYYYLSEDQSIEGLTGASVMVNTYQAKQLYCHYTSDNMFLVTWLIEDPSDTSNCYYLAIEFTSENSDIMACSSTFQTVKDFNDNQ